MSRVLYAYCTKPDAAVRVRALEIELGWEPVLIYTNQAREQALREAYPDGRVHLTDELYLNVSLPKATRPSAMHLIEDLQYIAQYATGLLSIMDRFALPDEFTTCERLLYLRRLVHEWGALLDQLAPDILHFDETPHGAPYVVMYHLAQRRGIRTVWFVPTGFVGYNLLADTIGGAPLQIVGRQSPGSVPPALLDRLEELRAGEQFPHWYMDLQEAQAAQLAAAPEARTQPNLFAIGRLLRKAWRFWRWGRYARHVVGALRTRGEVRRAREAWLEQPNEQMQFMHFPPTSRRVLTNAGYLKALDDRVRHKRMLEDAYASVSSHEEPLDLPFVYFPLHFQPERTTNPEGGLLEDQFIAIATLHDALPQGWLLYVKEHPTQFHPEPVLASEIGRHPQDYDELRSLPNVRLIGMGVPSALLVRKSRATVTITGTAGWEAAVNGVPGIHMAHTWYEGFPGTRYAPGFSELQAFFAGIDSYVSTSPQAENEYLTELLGSAFCFEISEQDLPPGTFSLERQAAGAVEAMRWWERSAR